MNASAHHDGLTLVSLASGSRGNCTWVGGSQDGFLIDCGVSTRQVFARLDSLGMAEIPIRAVLLTHDHDDHVAAAAILDRQLERRTGRIVPFFATQGTWDGVPANRSPRDRRVAVAGEPIHSRGWTIEPHSVPHDTRDPVAWAIDDGRSRAAVITDLGHPTRLTEALLASVDLAVLEFNHDLEMLLDGSYPWPLKQRIRGRHGHLSNADGAALLRRGASGRLQQVLLGHLSEENNRPELALEAALQALRDAGKPHVSVQLACQDKPTGPLRARMTAQPVPPQLGLFSLAPAST